MKTAEEIRNQSFNIVNSYHPHLVETEIRDMIYELHELWYLSTIQPVSEGIEREKLIDAIERELIKPNKSGYNKAVLIFDAILPLIKASEPAREIVNKQMYHALSVISCLDIPKGTENEGTFKNMKNLAQSAIEYYEKSPYNHLIQ